MMLASSSFTDKCEPERRSREIRDRVEMATFERGLILLGCGTNPIRWSPPLILSEEKCRPSRGDFDEGIAAST